MDLEFDASGTTNVNAEQVYDRTQITLLRLDATNVNGAFDTGDNSIPITDQYTVQDSTSNGLNCEDGQGCVTAWIMGTRVAFQGNHLDNTRPATGVIGGEHVLRFPKVTKGVISNNDVWNPNSAKTGLKLHSSNSLLPYPYYTWDGTYTELVVIADNYFKGVLNSPFDVAIEAQNGGSDERLRNIIVERNYLTSVNQASLLVVASTVGCTIRNNIFNMGDTTSTGIAVGGYAGYPSTDNINIYNNTFYTTSKETNIFGATVSSTDVLSVTAKNNLYVAPIPAWPAWRNTGQQPTLANNITGTVATNYFTTNTPNSIADFKLKAGSVAIGAGTPIPVWDDFSKATRATTWDVGAYLH
jgi:hypothetical protein